MTNLNKFLVFDIETIYDKKAIAESEYEKWGVDNWNNYYNKMMELNPKSKTFFAKHCFHHVVCISYVYIDFPKNLVRFGVSSGIDEFRNLNDFWIKFSACCVNSYPTLVTFNGKQFDVPVINLRSMKHLESFNEEIINVIRNYHFTGDKWENNRPNYMNRYSKYHIDLMTDMNSGFGNYFSLANLCAINDISVKTTAQSEDIEDLVKQEKWNEIDTYCLEDSLATSELLMRYLYFTNPLEKSIFDNIVEQIFEFKRILGLAK